MLVIEEGGETFDTTVNLKTLAFVGRRASVPARKDLIADGIRRNFKLEVLGAGSGRPSRFSCA